MTITHADPPLPHGFRLTLDPSAKQLGPALWFGGMPPRVLRLSPAGQRAWQKLQSGPVDDAATATLGRRFTDAGLAHPVPPREAIGTVTVVVPVRDRAAELGRCLAAIGTSHPVVVVDDGSADPRAVRDVAADHCARLVRRERNGGPGAARNTGMRHVGTEFVAFLDSDCAPPADWIARLLPHFADPLVAAVAPRISPDSDGSWPGRYARARSSLDLGGSPARVAPRTLVSYVPTAALIVRAAALPEFDETLRVGEDVDLVWRLCADGWRVRYDPSVAVPHHEPTTWRALLARRFRYGTSAAPLARRHPDSFAPLVLHPWPTIAAVALLARRPALAAAAAGSGAAVLRRTLRRAGVPTAGLLPAVGRSVYATGLGLGRYLTQLAAPALVAGLMHRRTRLAAAALLLAAPVDSLVRTRPSLDPPRFLLGELADQIAYGAGVWAGCRRERSLIAVRPVVVRRPVRVESPPQSSRPQPSSRS